VGVVVSGKSDRPRAVAVRLGFTCLIVAIAVRGASLSPAGLPRLLEINDHLYRGAQPSPEGWQSLAHLGVRAVIDLRATGARSVREEKAVEAVGMKYYSVPMRPLAAPTDRQVRTVLALIGDANNWPVFIHCEHGRDRTGTVIACYRIQYDRWTNEEALREARKNGLSAVEHGMRGYILQFKPMLF
jgi:tyrosine-protein phosphatase SIW14